MSAAILVAAFVLGQVDPEKAVSDAEKQEFLKVLRTLPSRGEFFTEEAVKKAEPYTRVLLALTEKDLAKFEIYPFLALSRGLIDCEKPRQYGIKNFDKIAHPMVKLLWASVLFREGGRTPEIIAYLRKLLDSKEGARSIAEMSGPAFEDFKEAVILASEAGKLMNVELIKRHAIKAFPKFGVGLDYTNRDYLFAPDGMIYAVRPEEDRLCGELISYDLNKGTGATRLIPQPAGFKAELNFLNFFNSAVISVNAAGDLSCFWSLGVASLKKGDVKFQVNDSSAHSTNVVAAPDGTWHVIQPVTGFFVIHRLDKDLKSVEIGKVRRNQASGPSDARFITGNILHLLSSSEENFQGGLRCVDFDVKERKVIHDRALLSLERWVSAGGSVLQTSEGSLHYVWTINDRRFRGEEEQKKMNLQDGVYYQSESRATTVQLNAGRSEYQAVALGDRIVVCYTQESTPNKAFFRVIRHGGAGPVIELTVGKNRQHNVGSEYMVLHAAGERLWFVNTLEPNALYELKLVDTPAKNGP